MLAILREFIVEAMTFNYWMRRPRNNHIGDVSGGIEQQRQDAFRDDVADFDESMSQLRHEIEVASDIEGLEDAMERHNCDAYDVAADPTDFEQAAERGDLEAVRRCLLMGLGKWSDDKKKAGEINNYDTSSIDSHPMVNVRAGGPSKKRSMGY